MFGRLFGAKTAIYDSLPEVRGKYIENAKLAKHTWFGVGGPAEVLFLPHDAEDLSAFLIRKPESIPVTIIGGGSNLLIRDGGIPLCPASGPAGGGPHPHPGGAGVRTEPL